MTTVASPQGAVALDQTVGARRAGIDDVATGAEGCFHCVLPLERTRYDVTVDGKAEATCCRGCQAVAQTIVQHGLSSYYRHRTAPAERSVPSGETLSRLKLYDLPEVQRSFVRASGPHEKEATVAMTGDGVNDVPVLAGAQVSLALGGGAHLAHASADMIVMSERLDALIAAVRVAHRTRRIIRQNLAAAITYNALALPLAAFGHVTPLIAALGMSLSSLMVVGNALRLQRLKTVVTDPRAFARRTEA